MQIVVVHLGRERHCLKHDVMIRTQLNEINFIFLNRDWTGLELRSDLKYRAATIMAPLLPKSKVTEQLTISNKSLSRGHCLHTVTQTF